MFHPYAETHYKFRLLWSPLHKRWPEIFLDAPHQLLPDKELSIYILVKDANLFPVNLKSLKITAWDEHGAHTEQFHELQIRCDQNFFTYKLKVPRSNFQGMVRIRGEWTVENHRGQSIQFTNHNFPGLPPGFLEVNLLQERLPYPELWKAGEMHCHSEFSSDPVEFGAPLARMQEVADAVGLDFVLCTDHSYDFYYRREQYLIPCDPNANFREYQNQAYALNTTYPSLPTMVPGEEVSCGNSLGQNVHLLVFGPKEFLPGLGDGGRRWFKNRPDLKVDQVLERLKGIPTFAAHPKSRIGWLERKIFRRGEWNESDISFPSKAQSISPIHGLQFWNGHLGSDYRLGKAFWVEQLLKGNPILPIGANDAHGDFNQNIGVKTPLFSLYQSRTHLFGKVRTLIPSPSKDIASLQKAFSQKKCLCTDGPFMDFFQKESVFHLDAKSNVDFGSLSTILIYGAEKGESQEKILYESHPNSGSMEYATDLPMPRNGYVRAEVITQKGCRALTSAQFF